MKKGIMAAACSLLALALLSGCHAKGRPAMYLETARLTEKEENLAELLGAGHGIFDFRVDGENATVSINVYRLGEDEKWTSVLRGGGCATEKKGRIALQFDRFEEGASIGIQSGGNTSIERYDSHGAPAQGERACFTTEMSGRCEIAYGQEIPLALQIEATGDGVCGDLAWFETPERFAREGVESVYIVTATFAAKDTEREE